MPLILTHRAISEMEFEDTIAQVEVDERAYAKSERESKQKYARQLESFILMYQDACQHAILQVSSELV